MILRDDISVRYYDLLRVPFKDGGRDVNGVDCVGLVKLVLDRLGTPAPDGAFPNDYLNIEDAFAHVRRHIEPQQVLDPIRLPWADYWRPVVTRDIRPGDMAFFFDGDRAHVASVVHRSRGGTILVLTASARRGVTVLPLARIPKLLGIYRLRA